MFYYESCRIRTHNPCFWVLSSNAACVTVKASVDNGHRLINISLSIGERKTPKLSVDLMDPYEFVSSLWIALSSMSRYLQIVT